MKNIFNFSDLALYYGKLYFWDGEIWLEIEKFDSHGGAPDLLDGKFRCRHYDFPHARFYLTKDNLHIWRNAGGIVDSDRLSKFTKESIVNKFLFNAMFGKFSNA